MRFWSTIALVLLALLSAGPAAADWLVLRDGGAIQTDGSWQVKGKLLVFHRADGSLSSLRLDAVDLEASERRTAAAKAPKPRPVAKAAPEREIKPVLVLTDADVAHVESAPRAGEDDAAAESPEVAEAAAARDPGEPSLRVTSWGALDNFDFTGIKLGGTLRNDSPEIALNSNLTVRLIDDSGRTIGRSRAVLEQKGLEPGASTNFEVEFPGVYEYAGVEFEPQSFNAVRRSPALATDETAAPEDQ